MNKVILFTNKPSILKHWENALSGLYHRIHIDERKDLENYLKTNTSPIIVMVDELSIANIEICLIKLEPFPQVRVLLFNSIPEVHHASLLIGGIVKGYENSFLDKANLIKMLRSVESGKRWLFPDLTHYIINKYIDDTSTKEPEFMPLLTAKEKEVALMVADGLTNKEIAQSEKIALSTVKGHIHKIFEKAGVSDRVSLALKFK